MSKYDMCQYCGGGWDIGHTDECWKRQQDVKEAEKTNVSYIFEIREFDAA